MKSRRPLHIVLAVLAVISAMVLFVTYGKTIPVSPFDTVRLEQPTVVDSDGEVTAVVVGESRRALVLNSSGDLTGIINCETLDSPIDAITDVCVSNGLVIAG
ncbi:MAG: hypothetical protein IJI68_08215 [Eggerthellaceae bacterium]|nr:hypothetical protein [Eggerthellaceae bacterium]